MPRLQIALPERFHYKTEIAVRITDLNYGGHVGNSAILDIAHEARVAFLQSLGWSEMDVDGVGIIMSDAALLFKSESFYGDVLAVEIAVIDMGRVGCDLIYLMTNAATGREVARVKTGIVFFDYATRKPKSIPERFQRLFAQEGAA